MVFKRPDRGRNMGNQINKIKQKYQTGRQSEKGERNENL